MGEPRMTNLQRLAAGMKTYHEQIEAMKKLRVAPLRSDESLEAKFFHRALMNKHDGDWSREAISEAAHVCAAALAGRRAGLRITASALLPADDPVAEVWVLLDDNDGEWVHLESGERGPLSEILRSIASCYLTLPALDAPLDPEFLANLQNGEG